MPTTAIATFSGQKLEPYQDPDLARCNAVGIIPSVNYAKGTVLGQVTANGLFKAYASGNADGSQNPTGILAYDIAVDASSNITLSATANQAGGDMLQTTKSVDVYYGGVFRTNDLTGLDANAITKLGGALTSGSVTDGIFRF